MRGLGERARHEKGRQSRLRRIIPAFLARRLRIAAAIRKVVG
jgi:hypothetical protein